MKRPFFVGLGVILVLIIALVFKPAWRKSNRRAYERPNNTVARRKGSNATAKTAMGTRHT